MCVRSEEIIVAQRIRSNGCEEPIRSFKKKINRAFNPFPNFSMTTNNYVEDVSLPGGKCRSGLCKLRATRKQILLL